MSATERQTVITAEQVNANNAEAGPVLGNPAIKSPRALVFAHANDYGVNVNMHTQTQNELALKQQRTTQYRAKVAGPIANAWQKPA